MGWDYEDAGDAYWGSDVMSFNIDLPKKEETMSTTAKKLRALIKEAQEELAKIERRPVEPTSDLVVFEFQFTGYGRVYSYAAIRVDKRWYVTGRKYAHGSFLWHDLWDHFEKTGTVLSMVPAYRSDDPADRYKVTPSS